VSCGDTVSAAVPANGRGAWSFTMPFGGAATFSSCDTGIDTLLYLDGQAHDELGPCGTGNEQILATMMPGETAAVAIGFYDPGQAGTVWLSVVCTESGPGESRTGAADMRGAGDGGRGRGQEKSRRYRKARAQRSCCPLSLRDAAYDAARPMVLPSVCYNRRICLLPFCCAWC